MFQDLSLALSQVSDRRFVSVLVKSLGLTIGLLIALIALTIWSLAFLPSLDFTIPWIDYQATFMNGVAGAASVGLILLLSMFLMFPVAALFVGLFLEEIADAVEARYYPGLPPPMETSIAEGLIRGVKFTLVLIAANGLALIIYLLSTVFAPFVFWVVNGYLLGREYFELVALRRMDEREAKRLRRKHFFPVWFAGVGLAAPLSVPILALIAPVIGVAVFVHFYHRITGRKVGS